MRSGGADFPRYLTSRKAPKHHSVTNMKATIYGNRLPRGTQVEKSWEPLF